MKHLLSILSLTLMSAICYAAPVVQFITTAGIIEVTLNPKLAPATVKNFITYVKEGHYDGTIFHRVIPNFVIQGGGHTVDMLEKPTHAPIKNEANKHLKNTLGTIAMARTMDPHSATAQFFINVADNGFLDFSSESAQGWGYTVFGYVSQGMDVVKRISSAPTSTQNGLPDFPQQPVIIQKSLLLKP